MRDSGGPAVTPEWCSKWCSGGRGTTSWDYWAAGQIRDRTDPCVLPVGRYRSLFTRWYGVNYGGSVGVTRANHATFSAWTKPGAEVQPCKPQESRRITGDREHDREYSPIGVAPMIVLGDISGIQNYLFDVSDAGGGQAQRLRARSFFIQILAEAAALRVLGALGWSSDEKHFVLSGAGKFLLKGDADSASDAKLTEIADELASWLLAEVRGELRVAIAWDDHDSDAVAYEKASKALREAKLRPWIPRGAWDPSCLVLPPLGRPCDLCGHATAVETELDDETDELREVCSRCAADRAQGRRLSRARWLLFRRSTDGDRDVFGLDAQVLTDEQITTTSDVVGVANLAVPNERPEWCPPGRFLRRRFTAHVPADTKGKPVWFVELARKATGDQLLGVLKADADSLGVAFGKLLDFLQGFLPHFEALIGFGSQFFQRERDRS